MVLGLREMKKTKPNYSYQDVMGYEAPKGQGCQSHLSDETLEQMKKDFELSKKLNTPKTMNYLMRQHNNTSNEHLCHWLTTDLGKAWVERQERGLR